MLPALPVLRLRAPGDDETNALPSTLKDACAGKVGVIDLWHTNCTKCPAALTKLNETAPDFDSSKVMHIACALSVGAGNVDDVSDFINDWNNLHHIFVEEKDKDELKALLGYSAVPFYVFFDQNGRIVKSGDSKAVDCKVEIEALLGAPSSSSISFDEDF